MYIHALLRLSTPHSSIKIYTWRYRLLNLLRSARLRLRLWRSGSWTSRLRRSPEAHHTAHHVEQGVSLPWYTHTEIHFSDLRQRVAPSCYFLKVRSVVLRELFVQIAAPTLYRQQQQSKKV